MDGCVVLPGVPVPVPDDDGVEVWANAAAEAIKVNAMIFSVIRFMIFLNYLIFYLLICY